MTFELTPISLQHWRAALLQFANYLKDLKVDSYLSQDNGNPGHQNKPGNTIYFCLKPVHCRREVPLKVLNLSLQSRNPLLDTQRCVSRWIIPPVRFSRHSSYRIVHRRHKCVFRTNPAAHFGAMASHGVGHA